MKRIIKRIMKKKAQIKRYNGVSLIELLITLIILMVVMLLVSVTLSTMIRASVISTAKTTAREESEFILELLRRTVRNSHTSDIRLYNVSGREFDNSTFKTSDFGVTGYDSAISQGEPATEIHFRPVGYTKWICVGYFRDKDDANKGYILKSGRQDLTSASECFNGSSSEYSQNTIVLNSDDVKINSFQMVFFNTYDDNYIMTVDLDVEPTHWVANSKQLKPNYFRQAVVSTQKLTWE